MTHMKLGYDVLLETTGQPPEIKPKDWGAVTIIAGDGITQEEKEEFLLKVADVCDDQGWPEDANEIRHNLIPQSRKEWAPPTPSTDE